MVPACYKMRHLSSSDSLDSFSNFDKLKPYDFEPTVSDNENADGEVSSSAMQTKEAEEERKGNLDWCLYGKCRAMYTSAESLCWREKNELLDKILIYNFFHFWLDSMNFMHTEAGVAFSE